MPYNALIQILINGLVLGMIYIFVAVGLSVIFSMLRLITFAHGEMFMLGGFATWLFINGLGLPYYIGLALAVIVMFLIGALLQLTLWQPLQKDPMRCLIMSLALSSVLIGLSNIVFGPLDKSVKSPITGVMQVGNVYLSNERIAIVGSCLIMLIIVIIFFKKHKLGIAMRAVSLDTIAASLQGINVKRLQMIGFGIGCALAAFAGGLIGTVFTIHPTMGATPILKAFVVVVLGGLGSIPGSIVAGLIIGMLDSIATTYFGSIGNVAAYIVFISVLLFRPRGLMGYEEA
ncbi:MAG: branched-chain amino acid ABC transporter permease [Chloroflexi bacterium HGW-Chloroflexi-2]|jgi:branched-chain amino acid transport system permease protein|nr:MAG: branched-chain amino acid ABC transporter permease [Chloroflexi bacterium HGW-Chloroflexi-2]